MLAQAIREKFARDAENEIILTDVSGGEILRNGDTETETLALDITDADAVKSLLKDLQPDLVINCAAYTAVDQAETHEDLAYKINADGPKNLAAACAEENVVLVHISTDYVFGGGLDISEEYHEDDPKHPETAYGRTKLTGEENIVNSGCSYYIFRTAWLYGQAGKNFVRTMLDVGKNRDEVEVVDDQHGSPTYTEDLTSIIYQAVTKVIPFGIYNATNLGFTTWADFTRKIYELAGVNCEVKGISSAEYEKQHTSADQKIAKRPLNSQMSKQKLLDAGVEIPDWEDGLKRYLKHIN